MPNNSGNSKNSGLRLRLTPEQQQQIRKATGKNASSLELSVEDIQSSMDETTSRDESGESAEMSESSESSESSTDYESDER